MSSVENRVLETHSYSFMSVVPIVKNKLKRWKCIEIRPLVITTSRRRRTETQNNTCVCRTPRLVRLKRIYTDGIEFHAYVHCNLDVRDNGCRSCDANAFICISPSPRSRHSCAGSSLLISDVSDFDLRTPVAARFGYFSRRRYAFFVTPTVRKISDRRDQHSQTTNAAYSIV